MTREDLLKKGWKPHQKVEGYWRDPKYPAVSHSLADALEIQQARDRKRKPRSK